MREDVTPPTAPLRSHRHGIGASSATARSALRNALSMLVAKFLRFGLIGTLCGAIYAVTTAALVYAELASPAPASILGYIVALPLNFFGQRSFAFRASAQAVRPQLIRFLIVTATNLLLSFAIMHAAVDWIGIGVVGGIVLTVLAIPFVTFFVFDNWVFTASPRRL